MRKRIVSLLTTFLILGTVIVPFIPSSVFAVTHTYYVSTTGNDANTGLGITDGTAWLTFQHAIDTATTAGDTVNIIAGNYASAGLKLKASGSAVGGYITFQASGVVNLTLTYTDAWESAIETDGYDYLKFIGFNITCAAGAATYAGFYIENSDHVTVQDCYITGSEFSGIYGETCTNLTIDNCEIDACCVDALGEECLSFSTVVGFEIKNCTVHDPVATDRCGIDVKVGSTIGSIHDNVIYGLLGNGYPSGIYVDSRGDADSIDIYNNLIYNIPGGYGIELGDETADATNGIISNINIYNNIIYETKIAICLAEHGTTGNTTFTNISVINNTGYDNNQIVGEPEVYANCRVAFTTNVIIRNNLFVGTVNGICGVYDPNHCYAAGKYFIDHNLWYTTVGAYDSSGTYLLGTDTVITNPLLIAPTTNFHIPVVSPAKDAGSATDAPATDYIGVSRPQDLLFDIGAYEYSEVPAIVDTQAATAVGETIATLNGEITDMGDEVSLVVTFEYGLNIGYGLTATADESPMVGIGTVHADIIGLSSGFTYHFRVKVVGDVTVYGDDETFVTDYTAPIPASTAAIQTMSPVIVLVYLAFSILLVLYMVEQKTSPLKILITIGVLIYVALALLPAVNSFATTVLGI